MSKIVRTENYGLIGYDNTKGLPTFLNDITNNNGIIDEVLTRHNSDIEQLQIDVENLTPEGFENLVNRVGVAETNISSNSELIKGIETRLTDDEENIKQHSIRLDNMRRDINLIDNTVVGLRDEVTENDRYVRAELTALDAVSRDALTKANNAVSTVEGLDHDVDGLNESLQSVSTNVETIAGQITDLQQRASFTEDRVVELAMTRPKVYSELASVDDFDSVIDTLSSVTGGEIVDSDSLNGMTIISINKSIPVVGYLDGNNIKCYPLVPTDESILVKICIW